MVAPQQWNQLGTRLLSLQSEIKQLLAAQEAASAALAAQAAVPAPTPASPDLAAELTALRADVAALGSSVQALTQLASEAPGGLAGRSQDAEVRRGPGLAPVASVAAVGTAERTGLATSLGRLMGGRHASCVCA